MSRLLWFLALIGCGDAIVDEAYRGVPLASYVGAVQEEQPGLIRRGDLRLAVFWSPGGEATEDLESLVEQPSTGQQTGTPSDFELHLYDAPPASRGYALGRVLVYADLDGDERRGADEPFLGADRARALLYAPTATSEAPTRGLLTAGFHMVELPLPCDRGPTAGDADCGFEPGAACEADADCGPGLCLREHGAPWPGGACAQPEPPTDGCRPAGAAFLPAPPDARVRGYWVKACEADAECARDEGYHCDAAAGACVPDNPVVVKLSSEPSAARFCTRASD